jgi:quinol-cytochrome oxidoreductase complex cytochrome b subunit
MSKQNLLEKVMNEPQPMPRKVPDYMRKKGGIWYWTGAMIMIAFLYEAVSGLIIYFYYQPSNAYASTEAFLKIPYGSLILTTHLYGAYIMIALVYIHLLRNLFVGAYKQPRQMQWLSGIILLVMTVAVAYFGYSMTGDVLSADATDVGRGIANGFPVIGSYLSSIFLGTGTALSLFSRLEGWHIVLAGGILVLFALHFFLAEYNTIMPHPKDVDYKVPAIDKDDRTYKPWYPHNLLYMTQVTLFTLAIIFIIPSVLALIPNVPALFSPLPSVSVSSPLASLIPPYPPWFLLFVYKELDFGIAETLGPFWAVVLFTGMPLVYLLAVPYFEKSQTLRISRRHLMLSTGLVGVIYLVGLSTWGALQPGVPVSNVAGFLFFAIPLLIVIPIVYKLASHLESGRSKLGDRTWKIYSIIPFTAFIAIMTGMTAVATFSNPTFYYITATIVLIVILAISSLTAYGLIYGIKFDKVQRRMSGRGHVVFGSVYGVIAIALLTIISVMPATPLTDQALYGVGMGLLFVIGATFIKLYRSFAFGE